MFYISTKFFWTWYEMMIVCVLNSDISFKLLWIYFFLFVFVILRMNDSWLEITEITEEMQHNRRIKSRTHEHELLCS